MIDFSEISLPAHIVTQRFGMSGIHPVFRTNKDQLSVFFKMLNAFKNKDEKIVAQTVKVLIP